VLKTLELLRSMPSLVDVDVPNGGHFTVCGDVHGQVFMFRVHHLKDYIDFILSVLFIDLCILAKRRIQDDHITLLSCIMLPL
jgi:hypothetical protein